MDDENLWEKAQMIGCSILFLIVAWPFLLWWERNDIARRFSPKVWVTWRIARRLKLSYREVSFEITKFLAEVPNGFVILRMLAFPDKAFEHFLSQLGPPSWRVPWENKHTLLGVFHAAEAYHISFYDEGFDYNLLLISALARAVYAQNQEKPPIVFVETHVGVTCLVEEGIRGAIMALLQDYQVTFCEDVAEFEIRAIVHNAPIAFLALNSATPIHLDDLELAAHVSKDFVLRSKVFTWGVSLKLKEGTGHEKEFNR